jgi:hypothetical protein
MFRLAAASYDVRLAESASTHARRRRHAASEQCFGNSTSDAQSRYGWTSSVGDAAKATSTFVISGLSLSCCHASFYRIRRCFTDFNLTRGEQAIRSLFSVFCMGFAKVMQKTYGQHPRFMSVVVFAHHDKSKFLKSRSVRSEQKNSVPEPHMWINHTIYI